MKNSKLVITLALVFVMAFGGAAFAAQAINGAGYGGTNNYQATPTTGYAVYDGSNVVPGDTTFKADGETNYPYEIYLPNENHPEDYRIHSNYTKNTDACASCHATHTAVGASLLQWYSTYETCMACHDGTVTTTYNVEEGEIGNTEKPTFGGAFGHGTDSDFSSSHNVQGSVSIAAAPGGSVVSEKATAVGGKVFTMWNTSFGCESCHSPHGQGGNARVLHPDPNGYATKISQGVFFELVADGGAFVAKDAKGNKVTLLKGYPYQVEYYTAAKVKMDGVTATVYNGGDLATGSFTKFSNFSQAGAAYVKGTAAITVRMDIDNYLGLNGTPTGTTPEDVKHISGINTYCGACHVDYNTEIQSNVNGGEIMGEQANRPGYGALTGVYSSAHRHAVGLPWNYGDAADTKYIGWDGKLLKTMGANEADSQLSCLTCHFAHGANDDIWKAWTAATGIGNDWASADMRKEQTGSSALKRLPNMATCEACHQKGNAAEGYAANTSQNAPGNGTNPLDSYLANAAHEAFFKGNTYQDATTCLTCHSSAADDIMSSAHWNTDGASSANKDFFGGSFFVKDAAVFNDQWGFPQGMPFGMSDRFCGFPGGAGGVSFAYKFTDSQGYTQEGNSCGKCHISINLSMPPLFTDFMAKANRVSAADIKAANARKVDCLACHLAREEYDPMVNRVVENGVFVYGNANHGASVAGHSNANFKVSEVGKSYTIQKPTNENCMTCHEHAMAGPVYKRHALFSEATDIHAAMNMDCMDCHPTSRHKIAKGLQATDLIVNDRPDVEVSCVASKCHPAQPHEVDYRGKAGHTSDQTKVSFLNGHTAKLACQACHVKTETDVYAKGAMAFVNNSQAERGYKYRYNDTQLFLFKGGAIFNDFRGVSGTLSLENDAPAGATAGYLGSIPEVGNSEWMMVQPGNYAWRWFNGTGTGMANAIASFGFYDPYYFQDGFKAFRGSEEQYAPYGYGMTPYGQTSPYPAQMDMKGALNNLFGMYWTGYGTLDMTGKNDFANELYNGAPRGGQGDKIYPFRKMQAWMPVPRTNFWFLTPHNMLTWKTSSDNINYLALRDALESPMMYMFFSKMFQPAMNLYAEEFGFDYKFVDCLVNGGAEPDWDKAPQGYKNLIAGMGGWNSPAAAGLKVLNGYIFDTNAYWVDDFNTNHGTIVADFTHAMDNNMPPTMNNAPRPTTAGEGQYMLIAGGLNSYMYFPMPLDANIMQDHAIAAKGFNGGNGAYEPRTCSECHTTPNGGATPKTFDNPDWNPLAPGHGVKDDAYDWGKNFSGTVTTVGVTGTSVIDWKSLGYNDTEIGKFTNDDYAPQYGLTSWSQYNN